MRTPSGTLTIAYTAPPAGWIAPLSDDPAATDLSALWGLPLFRYDSAGQRRPGLVRAWHTATTERGWTVTLELRPGSWSDGTPVTGEDVVATFAALAAAEAPGFESFLDGEVPAPGAATLVFDRETRAWPDLLAGTGGVLPAGMLADVGLDGIAEDLPVTGGWFRLEEVDDERGARFVANPASPLGSPGYAEIELLYVPRFDSALGMLEGGAVDALTGYVALNPVPRSEDIDGVRAGAPLGGTWVSLETRTGSALAGDARATQRAAIMNVLDMSELVDGLLDDVGATMSSPWPGVDGPWAAEQTGVIAGPDVVVLTERWQEALGFTARAVERALESHQVGTDLVFEEAPRFVDRARSERDLILRVRRDPPSAPLTRWGADEHLVAADASGDAGAAFLLLRDHAQVRPLYRIGVGQAWRGDLVGPVASSWPGTLLWNVGEWIPS